jgi:hypothetical protein
MQGAAAGAARRSAAEARHSPREDRQTLTRPDTSTLEVHEAAEPPPDFLADEPLGGSFYRAAGSREVPGFRFGFLVAQRAGVRVAVVPYFVTDFKLGTMLDDGLLKRLLGPVGLPIACVGHPCAPFGRIQGELTAELLARVVELLQRHAPVVAMKGFGHDLPVPPGMVRVPGLPVATLALVGNYWDQLKSKRRVNFRHKLKVAAELRFELVESLPPAWLDRVHALYLNTYRKANVRFEQLSRDYFASTAPLCQYMTVFLGDTLVGFSQLIRKGDRMVAFYMGTDDALDRRYGLYFALHLKIIDHAVACGCRALELGETNYTFKKELGSRLTETWVYYGHRQRWVNALLARFAFLLAPSEKELR